MSMLSLVAMLALAAPPAAPTSSASPAAQGSCFIVYGNTWAFMAEAPAGWSSACGDDTMGGSALTLWPADESRDALKAVIYVSVSTPGKEDLDAFVKHDMDEYTHRDAKFRSTHRNLPPMHTSKVEVVSATRRQVHVEHAFGDQDELVEYIKGPTAYFIVVLTTGSSDLTSRYRGAFKTFLKSFSPMTIKFEKGAKPPSAKH